MNFWLNTILQSFQNYYDGLKNTVHLVGLIFQLIFFSYMNQITLLLPHWCQTDLFDLHKWNNTMELLQSLNDFLNTLIKCHYGILRTINPAIWLTFRSSSFHNDWIIVSSFQGISWLFIHVCLSWVYCLELKMNDPSFMLCVNTVLTQLLFGQVSVSVHMCVCVLMCPFGLQNKRPGWGLFQFALFFFF